MTKSTTSKRTIVATSKPTVAELQAQLAEMAAELKAAKANAGSGRAEQALEVIKANPIFTTKTLATALDIESKNASSILNALKKRQHKWVKDGDNFIYVGKMSTSKWNEFLATLVPEVKVAKSA